VGSSFQFEIFISPKEVTRVVILSGVEGPLYLKETGKPNCCCILWLLDGFAIRTFLLS